MYIKLSTVFNECYCVTTFSYRSNIPSWRYYLDRVIMDLAVSIFSVGMRYAYRHTAGLFAHCLCSPSLFDSFSDLPSSPLSFSHLGDVHGRIWHCTPGTWNSGPGGYQHLWQWRPPWEWGGEMSSYSGSCFHLPCSSVADPPRIAKPVTSIWGQVVPRLDNS